MTPLNLTMFLFIRRAGLFKGSGILTESIRPVADKIHQHHRRVEISQLDAIDDNLG